METFPAFFPLRGKRVVIAGGGENALRKGRLFAAAHAELTFIAQDIEPALRGAFPGARFTVRAPRQEDFRGASLAVIAVDDPAAQEALAAHARFEGVPVNVVDAPALCDFYVPSIIDRGDVVAAVSTNGAAPVLGRRLRAAIEALAPARLGALASFARGFREAVAGAVAPSSRRAFWETVFDGPIAERMLAGDAPGARAAMVDAIARETGAGDEAPSRRGVVHIVGAGPGDPDLLTLRAARLLQDADIIFHDRLVGEGVLDHARRDAERVFVGKARADHAVPQREIEARMIEAARAGKRVVRLKGGDPFIFGRGGEELEAVRAAGVDVHVVPGVTAALGCAASAGMALTHRDRAQAVTFVTGHAKDGEEPAVDWHALARLGQTLVVYMGVGRAGAIEAALIEGGRAAQTPVAVIENGARRNEAIFKGVLGELSDLVARNGVVGPAILVIGDVAALAAERDLRTLALTERAA